LGTNETFEFVINSFEESVFLFELLAFVLSFKTAMPLFCKFLLAKLVFIVFSKETFDERITSVLSFGLS